VTQAANAGEVHPLSRRDRLRAATREEIIKTARRLLVQDGPGSVSLRAIAREMGMTAPGLYRYFAGREELLQHVVVGIFTELSGDIHQATQDAGTACADASHREVMTAKMVAACREFRRWALSHSAEFGLIFGAPPTGIDDECALQFADTFFGLFLELWNQLPFPVPGPDEIDAGLRDQLIAYRDRLGADLPAGAVLTLVRCWTLLYGAVAMEVFGHLSFTLPDPAPMFDITLGELAQLVGLRYPLSAGPGR
jgi:AcrR family transcriptional regulator